MIHMHRTSDQESPFVALAPAAASKLWSTIPKQQSTTLDGKAYTHFLKREPLGFVALEHKRTRMSYQLGCCVDRTFQEVRYFSWKSQILSSNSTSTLGNSAVLSSDLCTYIPKADKRTLPPTFKTEATWPTKEGLEDIICIKVYREEKVVVSGSETASYSFHNLEIVT